MSLNSTLLVRPPSKEAPLDSGTGLSHIEIEPRPWPGFSTSLRGKILRQAYGGLLLSLCQTPVYTAIQASLASRNHILETMKKGELSSPDLTMLPGNRIKNMH